MKKLARSNELGFTIMDNIVSLFIISTLALAAEPAYSKYVVYARSTEASVMLGTLKDYVQGYMRSHPDKGFSGPLRQNHPDISNANDWINEFIGGNAKYFSYAWDSVAHSLKAVALPTLGKDIEGHMIYINFADNGNISEWNVNPKDSILADILPR